MTTTVPNMQATIEALHAANLPCKVMVGGAVLTKHTPNRSVPIFMPRTPKPAPITPNRFLAD